MVNVEVGIDYMLWTEDKVFVRVGEVGAELAANLRVLPEPTVIVGIAMHGRVSLLHQYMLGGAAASCAAHNKY
jgi:hypothetical protein